MSKYILLALTVLVAVVLIGKPRGTADASTSTAAGAQTEAIVAATTNDYGRAN